MNRAIVHRWLNIFLLSFLGMGAGCLIADWQHMPPKIVASLFGELSHSWLKMAAIVLLCSVVAKVYLQLSPFSLAHFRFALRYPPTWVAAVIAGICVACLQNAGFVGGIRNQHDAGVWLWSGAAAIVGCLALDLVQLLASLFADTTPNISPSVSSAGAALAGSSSPASVSSIAEDWGALSRWIVTDQPIARRSDDLLDRAALVNRFADRLLVPFDNSVTIGLLGRYGSGKTSVMRMTQEEVAARNRKGAPSVIFCSIDCWGFFDSSAALQHILARILGELSKHVDCLALRQLPESYRNLLSGGGGWWASLAKFMSDSDPQAQLGRLTPILRAMNTRLVLIIEELDRPQSTHFDPQDIEATLYRFKSVPGVSFMLAGSREAQFQIAFTKLCDHIEEI